MSKIVAAVFVGALWCLPVKVNATAARIAEGLLA
jgi:hypothetical protein